MIKKETLTRKQATHLLTLIEQWTRAEVMSRSPAVGFPMYGDYYRDMLDKRDEIRRLIWDTDSLIELGHLFGLPVDPVRRRKIKHKKKRRKKHDNVQKS